MFRSLAKVGKLRAGKRTFVIQAGYNLAKKIMPKISPTENAALQVPFTYSKNSQITNHQFITYRQEQLDLTVTCSRATRL